MVTFEFKGLAMVIRMSIAYLASFPGLVLPGVIIINTKKIVVKNQISMNRRNRYER
jgi:hypothetical protein